MFEYAISATIFGQTVTTTVTASTLAEAANRFISSVRFTGVKEVTTTSSTGKGAKSEPVQIISPDGEKDYELTAKIGDTTYKGTVRSREIFQPIYTSVGQVTGIEELGPVAPPAGPVPTP